MTKQNLSKAKKAREREEVDEKFICEQVRTVRQHHPRMGCEKLYWELKGELEKAELKVGRDKFIEVLRGQDLMLPQKRSKGPRTTDSRHWLPVYPNMLRDRVLSGPNEAWVCDITYIRTREGFLYLALIMDAFSRKIVGFHIGDSLEVTGCLTAARMAIKQLPEGAEPIHHSDRGSQYCCKEYTELLKKNDITISMTEVNHCYENAKAERLNGILKQEYYLGAEFPTKKDGIRAARNAITLYNTGRRHRSLGFRKPEEVHAQKAA